MEHKIVTLADQIMERIEKDILSGKYVRDEILNEQRISHDLGVSRTPVREALKRLEQEHFLEETGHGLKVVGITKEDMIDYYAIRIRVEPLAAGNCAKFADEEALAAIGEALDMQEYYLKKEDDEGVDYSEKIKDYDSLFHELIYRNCHSNAYMDTLIPIHKKMTKYRKASVRKVSRAHDSVKEHREIYNALKERDAEGAGELVRKHVANARDSVAATDEE